MAMDFPNSPAVGDKYPVSPSTGQPQYTWNGTLWTTHGVSPPGPGKVPVWTDGTAAMTAQLTLVGDPVNPTDAADKHYVDNIQPPAGSVRYDTAQTLTSGQQTQAQNNIGISASVPSGTVMLLYQAAAPTGWTKLTTQNDKAIRVVSGSGGVAGGTNPFSTVMAQTATGNHTLVKAEIPAGITSNAANTIVTYTAGSASLYVPYISGYGWYGDYYYSYQSVPATQTNATSGPIGSISYTSYGQYNQNIQVSSNNTTGGAHNHPITLDIQYCDVIICSKN